MSLGPGGCPTFAALPSPYPSYPQGRLCDPFPLWASASPSEPRECCPEQTAGCLQLEDGHPCVELVWGTGAPPFSFSLTVQLYLIQSSQKREAENFFRITTVMPWIRHCPIPTMFPEGRGGTRGSGRQEPFLSRVSSFCLFWPPKTSFYFFNGLFCTGV